MCLSSVTKYGYKLFRRVLETGELIPRFENNSAGDEERYEPGRWYTPKARVQLRVTDDDNWKEESEYYQSGFHILLQRGDLDNPSIYVRDCEYYGWVCEKWMVEFQDIQYLGIDNNTKTQCVVANRMKLIKKLE